MDRTGELLDEVRPTGRIAVSVSEPHRRAPTMWSRVRAHTGPASPEEWSANGTWHYYAISGQLKQ
ncbi:hypothetical protein K461DRAFT_274343 [Myriangium duriaei CBS 260.36]|uniref:Uncharacterized protein n=1 Tax=Myriangium duriaei CBS 260.36 TaxID=1168546 RepID=A0A9P4JCI2_9PEZI|nr:hypothetical protein K461DRAFT_274343 [Myriangium duriaei CBS 260.36]